MLGWGLLKDYDRCLAYEEWCFSLFSMSRNASFTIRFPMLFMFTLVRASARCKLRAKLMEAESQLGISVVSGCEHLWAKCVTRTAGTAQCTLLNWQFDKSWQLGKAATHLAQIKQRTFPIVTMLPLALAHKSPSNAIKQLNKTLHCCLSHTRQHWMNVSRHVLEI